MADEAPFEFRSIIHIDHLLTFRHADHHLVVFVHAADTQALLHACVDACRKVANTGEKHLTHLIWHHLVHHAAHQHERCRNRCCCGDGLLVGLHGLVGRHECCALHVSSWQAGSFSGHPPSRNRTVYHFVTLGSTRRM